MPTRRSRRAGSCRCRRRSSRSTRRASPRSASGRGRAHVLAQLVDDINRASAGGHRHRHPDAGSRTRLSPERLLARADGRIPSSPHALAALPSNDAVLARALAAAPTVLAIAGTTEATGMPLRAPLRSVSAIPPRASGDDSPGAPRLPHYAGVLTSIDRARSCGDAAAASFRSIPSGGVIRRIPLVASVDGTLVPALAIEMLRVAIGAPVAAARSRTGPRSTASASATSSRRPKRTAPSASTTRRATRDRFVSAIDVLDGRFDPAQLQQEAGADRRHRPRPAREQEHAARRADAGRRDPRAAPGEPVRRDAAAPAAPGRRALEALVFLLLGALLVVATPRWKPRNAAVLALGCAAALLALALSRVSQPSACCSTPRRRDCACCCSSACCSC